MKKVNIWAGLVLLMGAATGCQSAEERARALYNQALLQEQQADRSTEGKDYDKYRNMLRQIAREYASTAVATDAIRRLAAIEQGERITSAKWALGMINSVQIAYVSLSRGSYANSFSELTDAGLLGEPGDRFLFPNGFYNGYDFDIKPGVYGSGVSYTATAQPRGGEGYFFFTDESGLIRYSIDGAATAKSPPLSGLVDRER